MKADDKRPTNPAEATQTLLMGLGCWRSVPEGRDAAIHAHLFVCRRARQVNTVPSRTYSPATRLTCALGNWCTR